MQLTLDRRTLLLAGAVIAMAVVAFGVGRALGGGGEPSAPAAKLTPVKVAPAPRVRALDAAAASPPLRPAGRKRTASAGTQTASQTTSSPTAAARSGAAQTATAGSGSASTSGSTQQPTPQQEEPVGSSGE